MHSFCYNRVKMLHLILVSIGLITAVHAKTDLVSCFDAAAPTESRCCEVDMSDSNKAIMKECRKTFPNNIKCDLEICYAEKKGFLFSNGTVDKSALEQFLEADFANYSNILSLFKQKCLNVEMNDYGHPEMCHLKKIANCMRFFVLANCPKWSNEQQCRKVKSASEECAKLLT